MAARYVVEPPRGLRRPEKKHSTPPACASASTISVPGIAGFSSPTVVKNGSSTDTCLTARTHSPASPPSTKSTSTNG